jgi:hypothetical protein
MVEPIGRLPVITDHPDFSEDDEPAPEQLVGPPYHLSPEDEATVARWSKERSDTVKP